MRISLSQMLLLVTLASVLCLFFFVVPAPFDVIVLMAISLSFVPAAVIVGASTSRGATKAFFLGAILGVGLPYLCLLIYCSIRFSWQFELFAP